MRVGCLEFGGFNHECGSIKGGVAERRVMKELGVPNIARSDLIGNASARYGRWHTMKPAAME